MTEQELTDRQADVLWAIRLLTRKHGVPPTVREIAAELGLSGSSTVHDHLKQLEAKGAISRSAGGRRLILITQEET